jgi:hypothetical protein
VPVEEVETTETVQKTTTEKITVCDSCGLNDDSGSIQIHSFSAQRFNEKLYFCDECLDSSDLNPITEKFSSFFSQQKRDALYHPLALVSQSFACQVAGAVIGGVNGLLIATGIALIFGLLAVGIIRTDNTE